MLDELGEKRLDAIGATVVRAFMAMVAKRRIQARGPVNLLRTLPTAAVETGGAGTKAAARRRGRRCGPSCTRCSSVTSCRSGATMRSGTTS